MPPTVALPTIARVARSIATTRLPAATKPREPSGAAAAARVRPPTGMRATTLFVVTSVSVAAPSPPATITTRAPAIAGRASRAAREASRRRRMDSLNPGGRQRVSV